jgi:hypothetical protein
MKPVEQLIHGVTVQSGILVNGERLQAPNDDGCRRDHGR